MIFMILFSLKNLCSSHEIYVQDRMIIGFMDIHKLSRKNETEHTISIKYSYVTDVIQNSWRKTFFLLKIFSP